MKKLMMFAVVASFAVTGSAWAKCPELKNSHIEKIVYDRQDGALNDEGKAFRKYNFQVHTHDAPSVTSSEMNTKQSGVALSGEPGICSYNHPTGVLLLKQE